jgi:integrase
MKIPKFTLDNDRGTYEVRFYNRIGTDDNGKPVYERPRLDTGLSDKRLAERKAPELIQDYLENKGSRIREKAAIHEQEAAKGPTLVANTKLYMDTFYTDKMADTTIGSNRLSLDYMIKYSPNGIGSLVSDITAKVAGDIWNAFCKAPTRLNRPPNEKGKAHFLRNVCAYWDWEVRVNKVAENPFDWIPKPKDDEFDEYTVTWTQREYEDIHGALALEEEKVALMVCRYFGMYPKDVFMLDTDQCRLDGDDLIINKEREKVQRKRTRKKRSKQIIRFIASKCAPKEVVEIMVHAYKQAVKRGGGRIFCTHYDKPVLWVEQFGKRVKAAWRATYPGVEPKPPKALRHTRATEWRKQGVDPEIIGNRLGHVKGSKMVLKLYSHNEEDGVIFE